MAIRIRDRAIRRAGELLKQVEPARGGDRGGGRGNQGDGTVPLVSRKQAAADAGISERRRKTSLRVANVPKDEFEQPVECDDPPTVRSLMVLALKSNDVICLSA